MSLNEKKSPTCIRKRVSKKLGVLLSICMLLFIFTATYLWLVQDAITKENAFTSSCKVWYNVDISYDEVSRTESTESDDVQKETETKKPTNIEIYNALVSGDIAYHDNMGITDFENNIDDMTISVNNGNNWEETTEFEHGDEIKISIAYTIDDPNETDVIYYKLPDVIKLDEADSGIVYFNGEEVGTYLISEDGFIIINFDDDKFDTGISFSGNISFSASVSASKENEDKNIIFDDTILDFTYEDKKEEGGDDKVYDLSVGKNVSTQNEDGSFDYTVTVSSKNGTNGENVSINDKFVTNNNGGQNANYDETSFVVTKTLEDRTTEIITPNVNVNNNESGSSFNIEDLPPLGENESYTIQYNAKPEIDTDNATSNGSMNVNNKAEAESGDLKSDGSISATVAKPVVDKTGSYDEESQEASWEIKIDPGVQDLAGYVLEDTVTASDGTVIKLEGATITDSDGNVTEITLPYTFPDDFDNTKDYVINYKADLSDIKDNVTVNVNNKVEISKGDEVFEDTAPLPPIYKFTYDIDKEFQSFDGLNNKYSWQTSIDIPSAEAINGDLICTDTIDTTLSSIQGNIQNAHYSTVGELRNIVVKVDGQVVDPSYSAITFTELNYKHYADNNINNSEIGDEVKVRDFKIVFSEAFLKDHINSKLTLDYSTYIDTKDTKPNSEYKVNNSASVGNKTVTESTDYKKQAGINKESSNNGNYNSDPKNYEYDIVYDKELGYAVMNYRVTFHTNVYSLEELQNLQLQDTLPEKANIIESSIKYSFGSPWGNPVANYHEQRAGKDVYAKDYLTHHLTGSDDNQVVNFSLLQAYFDDYDLLSTVELNWVLPLTFIIEYQIKLPPPSEWEGETEKTFTNSLSYGKEVVENDVTVESDEEYLSKSGWQKPDLDENGNYQYNPDGSLRYTNDISYTLIVNKQEQELNLNGSTVKLTDTMEFVGANGAYATLLRDEFFVYYYDSTKEDGKGELLDKSEYSYTSSEKKENGLIFYTFELIIPDNEAVLVEYTYNINTSNDTSSNNFHIKNSASLEGSDIYNDRQEIEFHKKTSSATVEQESMTLYKYQEGNEAVGLEGAKFYFEKYKDTEKDGTYEWVETAFGEDSTLTTDENGIVKFNLFDKSGKKHYEIGVLYRFTEIQAPEGYMVDDKPRYFVFVADEYKKDTLSYAQHIVFPENVHFKDVVFIVNDQTMIPISNTKNIVEVKKNWVDEDNETIKVSHDDIAIDLYRQNSKLMESHTIKVKSTANGTTVDGMSESDIKKTLYVADGSGLFVAIFNTNGIWQNITVNGQLVQSKIDPNYPNITYCEISDIKSNMDIEIKAQNAPGETFDFYFFEFEEAKYEPIGEKEYIGTYTITADDNWSRFWQLTDTVTNKELELLYAPQNAKNPYFYSVEESSVPSGFTVNYSDTNLVGITNGQIAITNVEDPYELPTTGSKGKSPFKLLGIAVFMATVIIYFYKKRQLS